MSDVRELSLADVAGKDLVFASEYDRVCAEANALRATVARLTQLLPESRTHLMQGDRSEWRKRVEAALDAAGGGK